MADATRYQRVADPVGAGLGLLFLVAYAWPILQPGLPTVAAGICWWSGAVIWVLLAADYAVRLTLAPHRLRFLRRTWLDLLMVVLPMFRPLRALRALLALRALDRLSPRLTRRAVVGNVVITVAASGAVAALAVLDAERDAPNATITNFGDALWWAVTTITTVGYGDRYPVTSEGRLIAGALMVAGIALVGVITASLASWFVQRIGEMTSAEEQTQATVEALLDEVRALRREVQQLRQHRDLGPNRTDGDQLSPI